MLKASTKPGENVYQAVIAQTKGNGQDTVWETKEIVATSFSVNERGDLMVWLGGEIIVLVAVGQWQRIERKDENH